MSFSFRPAKQENTPLIVGLAGPTKSGKTLSALRLANGMAGDGTIAMINSEGPRGHQYAQDFKYVACDIDAPYSFDRYVEVLSEVKKLAPAVLIIDSASHMHDGPGGFLEQHDTELDRMAGDDWKKRDRVNFTAWIKPKREENKFVYALLELRCHAILCFRAKEKLKLQKGKDPIDLGWQPIASERLSFETIFTLMLPPHCHGVPDISISDMRRPFDTMIPQGQPIDERLGEMLAHWSTGQTTAAPAGRTATIPIMPEGQVVDWCLKMEEAPNIEELGRSFTNAMLSCKELKDGAAQKRITAAKDKRKAVLTTGQ